MAGTRSLLAARSNGSRTTGRPADTGSNASFSFSNNDTAGFSAAGALVGTTGNAYASYLLGAVNGATITQNSVVEYGARYFDASAFVQDDWKVNSRLTLNLGGAATTIWAPITK